ncbi:hypothetical protein GPECTOR_11g238 [Gonium pectorale]|uniref:Uncharacterized protein n=1 Tax=Gonium pectorale TaxID=33097 RepID=A0A150GPR4_GONPE|nr:hypothetical protein GPECTOR_11g238 [Gonium pectorale]|eukprot:KXZ51795.1 hypothetical protein GPECTOR_11g238 [Gonium pectorale]
MEALLAALLHPLPLGRTRNAALFHGAAAPAVQLNGSLFFDPSATLSSTIRALTVIRQVLRQGGHVLVVNPNPTMRPLIREAAHLCLNSNVWFWYQDWSPGILSDPKRKISEVLKPNRCQPNRRLMAARGLTLRNPLCPTPPPAAPPGLVGADREALVASFRNAGWHADRRRRDSRHALTALLAARSAEARLLPAGTPSYKMLGRSEQLSLVVALDLSYGGEVVREAYERNIPSVGLLNGHSDASRVSYPVYGSEAHAGFQHFFLDWLLRLVNVRPEALASREP